MSQEQRIAGGTTQHAEDGQPGVRHVLRWEPSVSYTQHVGQRLEHRPGILLRPVSVLRMERDTGPGLVKSDGEFSVRSDSCNVRLN